MKEYIATCFSHFGAVRMKKICEGIGWPARLMPVPRSLSSSCGICVRYGVPVSRQDFLPSSEIPEEVERIVRVCEGKEAYVCLYEAEGI